METRVKGNRTIKRWTLVCSLMLLLTPVSEAVQLQADQSFAAGRRCIWAIATSPLPLFSHDQSSTQAQLTPATYVGPQSLSTGSPSTGIRLSRATIWGGFSAGALYLSYRQSQAVWGASTGRFHFKDDLTGDHMALSDEVSHLFAAYQLTEFISSGYRWIGMDPKRARRIGALETWALTFLAEFPIDAYNPTQGFGISDLVFNTAGVLAAYHHIGKNPAPRWDVKVSVKERFFDGESRLIAHTNEQYDDYIYWLTVRPSRRRYLPVLAGIGYSTDHEAGGRVIKELHFGVGTTLEDLGGLFGERTAHYLHQLNFVFFNIGTKITWR